jgi:glycosyltransferase involved in cell wall biosynthesis
LTIRDGRWQSETSQPGERASARVKLPSTILYVITDLNLGGVPLHLRRLALEMRARGNCPVVVSLARPGPVGEMLVEDGLNVFDCAACCGWDVRVFRRLARILARVRPDIVHSFLFHANLASRRAARMAGFPRDRLICELQTVEIERRWHLWVDRWTHRGCRYIVANSPSVAEHLHRKAHIPLDRLRTVRGGVDPGPFEAAGPISRDALPGAPGAPVVLWVGRLDPVKGLAVLIESFREVACKTDAQLLLAGEGPERGPLVRKIEDAGLSDRVHFLGARHDIPSLLKSADVFAFPSRSEGLPNALLEAMAASCPIVTTDVPGCRDLIEHERSGLLVRFGDARTLSSALVRLIRDREYAQKLGAQAHARVTESWHLKNTWDGYTALYKELDGGS